MTLKDFYTLDFYYTTLYTYYMPNNPAYLNSYIIGNKLAIPNDLFTINIFSFKALLNSELEKMKVDLLNIAMEEYKERHRSSAELNQRIKKLGVL